MKIQGSDLLPFEEAREATREAEENRLYGIGPESWAVAEKSGPEHATLDPVSQTLAVFGIFIPLRALKSESIRRLGLHHRPDGI